MGRFTRAARALFQKSDGVVWPDRARSWNDWQIMGTRSQRDFGRFAPVFACWRIIAEEVARVPTKVVRKTERGVKIEVYNKAPSRVLVRPNQYQTASDLKMFLTQSLLSDGNAYAFALRNDRFEVAAMYPVNPRKVQVHLSEEGEVFYHISDSATSSLAKLDSGYWVPQRDMLHVRLFTLDHPLKGVTPLHAAAVGINAGMNINQQTSAFFGNMGRPSGIISVGKKLSSEAVARIKERFISATNGPNAGAPVVLTDGMTWEQMSMSAVDAELIKSYDLSERQVAQIYRVPFFFLNESADMKLGSVESLMRFFINSGLGFYFSHIGEALTRFFDLPANESIIFDYETALLQGDLEGRMNAYKVGVQGGIFSVNDARGREGLPDVEYGDEVRMQQQMVPLSYGANVQPDTAAAVPAPAPTPGPADDDDETDDEEDDVQMSAADMRVAALSYRHALRKRLPVVRIT